MKEMDHERCSELLKPYVEGTLGALEAEAVRAHLTGCSDCRAEESALRTLLVPGEALLPEESAALRSRVWAEIGAAGDGAAATGVIPLRSRRTWTATRLLGAAALLIAGFVFVRSGLPLGGGDDAGRTADSGAGGAGPVAITTDRLKFRGADTFARSSAGTTMDTTLEAASEPIQDPEQSEKAAGDAGAGTGGDADGEATFETGSKDRRAAFNYGNPPRPVYVTGSRGLTDQTLSSIGRFGLPLVLFPGAYTTADAQNLADEYLLQLANAAEMEAQRDQVLDCGAQILEQGNPALPALVTFGTYQGEPTFVLALAWSESDGGSLDRFMVWTWPAGDCNAVPGYRAGAIKG